MRSLQEVLLNDVALQDPDLEDAYVPRRRRVAPPLVDDRLLASSGGGGDGINP